jgi:hypothetical protein
MTPQKFEPVLIELAKHLITLLVNKILTRKQKRK